RQLELAPLVPIEETRGAGAYREVGERRSPCQAGVTTPVIGSGVEGAALRECQESSLVELGVGQEASARDRACRSQREPVAIVTEVTGASRDQRPARDERELV